MEAIDLAAYRGRRVLVTGHTGFKGSWLVTWLIELGAEVTGFALAPPSGEPSLFTLLGLKNLCDSHEGDIRNLRRLRRVLRLARPDVVFHLAAQPLVRHSYDAPLETFDVNVRGTATLLEAIRLEARPTAVVIVTSDKCYRNRGSSRIYEEGDALGGHDPYSASKAAAELVTESYRQSFFAPERLGDHGVGVATARAGNVIGGGDWGHERLFPAIVAALGVGQPIELRAPQAIRPWQHVLDPLAGYLQLGARLTTGGHHPADSFAGAWNFGPAASESFTVGQLADLAIGCWGGGAWTWRPTAGRDEKHEATTLRLATDKAFAELGWRARLRLPEAVAHTVAWYRAYHEGVRGRDLMAFTRRQIAAFSASRTDDPAPRVGAPLGRSRRLPSSEDRGERAGRMPGDALWLSGLGRVP